MFRKRSRRNNTRHNLRAFVIAGVITGAVVASAGAKDGYGPHYPMPYPLGVGSSFGLTGDDGMPIVCQTRYAWEDGTSIARCSHNLNLSHDPESDSWQRWDGCHHIFRHGHPAGKPETNLQSCYGKSVADVVGKGK